MTRLIAILAFVATPLLASSATASSIVLHLDAQVYGQASPDGNGPSVLLDAGTYFVTPVAIADGGNWDAWSAWSANLDCDGAGVCDHGYEISFDYSSASLGYKYFQVNGPKYSTPALALAALAIAPAQSVTFTLASAESVSFGFNDCAGCLGDNRGGLSLRIDSVPESISPAFTWPALLGILVARARIRRHHV